MTHKLGRKPRAYDDRIPKMSAVRKTSWTVTPSPEIDYTSGMPANLGMMLNDTLGDCTAAAVGHAIQVWTHNTAQMVTPPDADILALYEKTRGYVPGNPNTDNGAVEQDVLKYWLKDKVDGDSLAAFIEIDVANLTEVKQTIYECGVCYIGFNVPAYLMNSLTAAGSVWDIEPHGDNTIVGGHAVILAGYDATGNMNVISWGMKYTMTPAFWHKYVDEAYALVNSDWIGHTGKTPAGMSLPSLETLVKNLFTEPTPPAGVSHQRRHRHHRRIKRQSKSS